MTAGPHSLVLCILQNNKPITSVRDLICQIELTTGAKFGELYGRCVWEITMVYNGYRCATFNPNLESYTMTSE